MEFNSHCHSDGDGFTDTVEIANGSTVTDASSTSQTFLNCGCQVMVGCHDAMVATNQTLSDGDAISTWMDLSGVGTHATTYALGSATPFLNHAICWMETIV